MMLIADSGSTKTDWRLVSGAETVATVSTKGMNPFFQTEEEIKIELTSALLPRINASEVMSVCFYGAGCAFGKENTVRHAIASCFPNATVEVNTDLLAAAHAACGRSAGIVGILGTGSNSCYYDGQAIVKNVSPLGFILGDEGSGAVLGRMLVGNVLKNQLSDDLCKLFLSKYELDAGIIIDRVYRQPFPNRFLAGLSPFLLEHIDRPEIATIVHRGFTDYFTRNIMQYDYHANEVHLVGSVAYYYKEILTDVAAGLGIRLGQVLRQPMDGLVAYHSQIK